MKQLKGFFRVNKHKLITAAAVFLIMTAVLTVIYNWSFPAARARIASQTEPVTKDLPQPAGKISFATWGNPKEMEILKLLAQEFYDRNNIMVDVFCFSDAYSCRTRILSQFAAGDPFDVFCTDEFSFNILAGKDHLLDLSVMLSDKWIKADDYYNSAFEKGIFDGRQMGIPTSINPSVIYYNKNLFEDAGIRTPEEYYKNDMWNEAALIESCEQLKDKKDVCGISIKNDWQTVFSIINNNAGSHINFANDGTVIADEEAVESVKLFKDMVDRDLCVYMGSIPEGLTEDELFKSQRVGMVYADYSYASLFKDVKDFKWDIIPFPSNRKGCGINSLSIPLISASKYIKDRTSAESFIAFYTSAQGQKLRFEKGEKNLPSLKYTVYNGETVFPEHSNYYFYSLSEGAMEPNAFNYLQNREKLIARFDDYWNGKRGIETVIRSD